MFWNIEPVSVADVGLRLTAAIVFGGVVGMNRNLHGKPAGLRTNALVSLGSAMAMLVGIDIASNHIEGIQIQPGQIFQGILQGIGFLGAGIILHSESGKKVHGLTTAASVWLSAILGIGCGLGAWLVTGFAFFLTFVVLVLGGRIEKAMDLKPAEDDSAS